MDRPDNLGSEATIELAPQLVLARVARAAAASCCAIAGFSVDRLADVRIVVDEVFNVLVIVGAGPILLRLAPAEGVVDLEMSADRGDAGGWRLDEFEMVRLLTDVTADRAAFTEHDGRLLLRARFGVAPV